MNELLDLKSKLIEFVENNTISISQVSVIDKKSKTKLIAKVNKFNEINVEITLLK